MQRAAKILCAAIWTAGTVTGARADGLTSRAILSYQTFDAPGFSAAGFSQIYDARIEKSFTTPIRYRLSFRAETFGSLSGSGRTSGQTGFRQIQPGGEISYELPKLQSLLAFDLNRGTPTGNLLAGTRRQDRLNGHLTWRPDKLPGITIEAQRNKVQDQSSGVNTAERLGTASLDYSLWKFRASATGRYSSFDDGKADFARKTQDRMGTMIFEDTFLGGRLTAFASGMATFSRLDERSLSAAGTSVPVPVTALGAYHSIDDTPLDGRDRRLIPTPALSDGNLDASAGISLGPDGVPFHNLALDLGRYAAIDEIQVVVRDGATKPVPFGGSVRWDAYTSDDGILWKLVTGGARTAFDAGVSAYSVTFALTTSRWFKVVNFGVNGLPTFVTEERAFFHTDVGPARVKTNIRLYSGTTNLTARPLSWLSLSYYGLYNSSSLTVGADPAQKTLDSDQVGAIDVRPVHFLSLMIRYQRRPVQTTGQLSQRFDAWTGLVKVLPAPALDLTLEMQRQHEDNQGKLINTNDIILHTYARVYEALDLTLDIGTQKQDFITEGRRADRRFLTGASNSQLFAGLKLLLTASVQRISYEGTLPGGELQLPSRDDRFAAEFFWRPGQPFAVGARIGWGVGDVASGLTQRYRIEWNPFAGGAVSIGGSFDQDIDPYSGRKSSRVLFSPRWRVNKHTLVDINYSLISMSGEASSRTRNFSAALTLTR